MKEKYDENISNYKKSTVEEIDLSQVIRNLLLTPEQRLIEHQSTLDLVIELEKAGKKLREQS